MFKKYFIIILATPLFLFASVGQNTTEVGKENIPNPVYSDASNLNAFQAYKMLYENQSKSNDAILQTIFYALSGLGAAIIFVFGSSWWFNDKKVKDAMNEIDLKTKAIKQDILHDLTEKINTFTSEKTSEINQIQVKLQEETTEMSTDLTSRFNNFIEQIRAEIKSDNKTLENSYQELLKSYSDNFSQQISTLKQSFEERAQLLLRQILENEGRIQEQRAQDAKKIQREILEHRAEIKSLEGYPGIALSAYIKLALLNFEIGYEWAFKYDAGFIMEHLMKVNELYTDDFDALNSLLEISEKKYPEQTDKIRKILAEKTTKTLKT